MFKKFITICMTVFLIALNAQAGSDGELALKKDEPKEIKPEGEEISTQEEEISKVGDTHRPT